MFESGNISEEVSNSPSLTVLPVGNSSVHSVVRYDPKSYLTRSVSLVLILIIKTSEISIFLGDPGAKRFSNGFPFYLDSVSSDAVKGKGKDGILP